MRANRSCGSTFQGLQFHKHWKLIDDAERKAREELQARLAPKPEPEDD